MVKQHFSFALTSFVSKEKSLSFNMKFLMNFYFTGRVKFSFESPEMKEKIILGTYLALNKVNIAEEDPLETEFGLIDDLIELYTHLGNE